jgi:hypothetical protein
VHLGPTRRLDEDIINQFTNRLRHRFCLSFVEVQQKLCN